MLAGVGSDVVRGGGPEEGEQPTAATSMTIVTSSQRAAPEFICVSFTGRDRSASLKERNDAPNHAIYSKLAKSYRRLLTHYRIVRDGRPADHRPRLSNHHDGPSSRLAGFS